MNDIYQKLLTKTGYDIVGVSNSENNKFVLAWRNAEKLVLDVVEVSGSNITTLFSVFFQKKKAI